MSGPVRGSGEMRGAGVGEQGFGPGSGRAGLTMRAAQFAVRVFARRVPAHRRAEWEAEWSSELMHAWSEVTDDVRPSLRARARLLMRALGALADVRSLRRLHGNGGDGGRLLRDATRSIRRRPGLSVSVVFTLALGMGSAVAIFTVLDGLMLRPLPFRDAQQLVTVSGASGGLLLDQESMAVWRSQSGVFAQAHAYAPSRTGTLSGGIEPTEAATWMVEPGFLSMLGITPVLGRDFTADESTPGNDRVVLLSDEVWRASFGRDRAVIGRVVQLDTLPYTIIGVLPATMRRLPLGIVGLVVPMSDPSPYPQLPMVARLRPGLTVESAVARLEATRAVLQRERPRPDEWQVHVIPLARGLPGGARNALWVLGGAVFFLLLIACTNAAGLLFVQGVARQPEFALRAALGGSRGVLFRQVFAESLLLALLAGIAGIGLAWWGVRGLLALAPSVLVRFNYTPIGIETRVLVFAFALTLLTGLIFGLAPAWRASRGSAARAGRGATASRSQVRLRSAVQVLQLAMAVMLLAGAGLLGRSFLNLTSVDPGYEPERLLHIELARRVRADTAATTAFHASLEERLSTLPGVTGYTRSSGQGFYVGYTLEREDGTTLTPASSEYLVMATVDTAYFRVMGIPMLEGRPFNASDVRTASEAVVMGHELAAALWPGASAVGRRFRVNDHPWVTVVGMTGSVKLDGPHDPLGRLFMFYPSARVRGTITLRTNGNPAALAAAVRRTVRDLDPAQPIRTIETGNAALGETIAQPRFLLVIMLVFAAVALLLAGIGVYSLIAFTISQRTRELGVRMALGARWQNVIPDVVGSGMAMSIAGSLLGLFGALIVSRYLRSQLFGLSPLDPAAYLLAIGLLLAASLVALLGPLRRALGVDPVKALRAD